MGTEKRDRQRAARLDKAIAANAAARKARTRRTGVRVAIGTIVIVAVLFGVSRLMGDDSSGDSATADDSSATTDTTEPILGASIPETFTNPELAKEVESRTPPEPTPFPANTPADTLETKTVIKGEGDGAKAGDTVTVHYLGNLADGTIFDESWSRGQPFPVALGQGQVIQGWDEGLVGAKIGERRHLLIGSDKAYGPNAQGDKIPANSPLAFDVDIVDIHSG